MRKLAAVALLMAGSGLGAQTSPQVTLTTVAGVVYQANGVVAQGTILISWPAFETAANQSVAAGSTSVTIGADGTASVALAPNQGAEPAGTYYTVVYHLTGQAVSKEYWTVPASGTATIAAVRAQVEPATVAVQTVSKAYVDNLIATIAPTSANYLALAGGAMSGPLTLPSDPVSAMQAATKHYVDGQVATAVPLSGGTVTGTLAMANAVTRLPRVDVRNASFAGGADPTGTNDSTAAVQAAIAFALASSPSGQTNYPVVYFPIGHYLISGTLRIPSGIRLLGDGENSTYLQETNATASLITVFPQPVCSVITCYGSVESMTLEGTGKVTTGNLLELDTGTFLLRDLMFTNTGGRGLQMNAASERVSGYNLSFYNLRWPMVMAGDSNEDYFYNTQVLGAGQTADAMSNRGYVNYYCYSVNCAGGNYPYAGTTAAPTTIYPDPHAAIDIDKAANVSFVGGSVKASYMISGVKLWSAGPVRFQNFYHEAVYYGGPPAVNRAYIVGGQGEQTYLTSSLSATGTSVTVNDDSWMPQFYGLAADAQGFGGDYYPYVILPQDYNPDSSAPSAYVSGVNQNQFELISASGFTAGNVLYINARHDGGAAPAGTVWPAGSVIEEFPQATPDLELDGVHINQVQGPLTGNGWTADCNETNTLACGEILVGYTPDIQSLTSTPATNRTGIVTQLGDPGDPLFAGTGILRMQDMSMFSGTGNPYIGAIVGEHRAQIEITGPPDAAFVESQTATVGTTAGRQISIGQLTGGSEIIAPLYSDGTYAAVSATVPGSGEQWDTQNGFFFKNSTQYLLYNQYGSTYSGLQYQNLYCMFDTPLTDGGFVQNRFCLGGGPGNATSNYEGHGGGLEYDSWNQTTAGFTPLFRVFGYNGAGTVQANAPTTVSSTLSVTGAATFGGQVSASGNAVVAGALSAADLNGTITVDGTTYKTLNAAWTAAVAQATATGKDQTVWLGPGSYPVAATMNEPVNGACVSVIGSAGTTTGADVSGTATTLTVPATLGGDVFFLGNAVLTEGCTFKDLNLLAGGNATHGFEMQWARGLLLDTVAVNDTTAEGILLGEETTTSGHQTNVLLRNVTVSYSASVFAPAARPPWGVHLQKTAIDSVLQTVTVRNALTAAVWNEGTGNLGYGIHGFGYPYTCTTAPCSNAATSGTAANASYASSYVIYDTGGAGSTWTDTYADSPAVSAFYLAANGTEVRGGHVQWPDLTSFPGANFATVTAGVTNNMLIANVSCLGMSSSVNWINYQSAAGVPPTFASVHHLTGCGNYYQALEPATTTGFSGGGASNNAPANGAVAAVWAAPKAAASTYSAFSAQEYTGYQGDLFDGHIAGQMPFFNITYQGTIRSSGGLALSTVINTASTLTLTTANKNVIANAAGGAQTITLPSCYTAMPDKAAPTGVEFTIVKSDTSANAVTLAAVSSQTINYQGSTAATLAIAAAGKRTLVCGPDNNWYAF